MSDRAVHSAVIRWLTTQTGITFIKAHPGAARPALPYGVANFTGNIEVREHPSAVLYEGTTEVHAKPVLENEWRYSLHVYAAEDPTTYLRPIRLAKHMGVMDGSLAPGLLVHDVSQIRNIPDWADESWEPRAQMDLIVRGVLQDETIEIDVIETYSFDIEAV